MNGPSEQPCVGILYPGEMGAAIAAVLRDKGIRVLTTLEGRSPSTIRRSTAAGVETVGSLRELLERSHFVLSLVSPGSALEVAARCVGAGAALPKRFLYVDVNSIGPETAQQISAMLSERNIGFVDGAIRGLASRLTSQGSVYLSGPRAAEAAELFRGAVRTTVVGDVPGQASAVKMILASIAKGMVGLFVEAMLLARQLDLLNTAMLECTRYYPELMDVVARLLPTYPTHAGRRVQEMMEVERTMSVAGIDSAVAHGVLRVHENLAATAWTKLKGPENVMEALIEQVFRTRFSIPRHRR